MGAENIQKAVVVIGQTWLIDHPILGWCIIHPLWAIGSVMVLIFLLWGLLRAIAQLAEKLWLILLRSPLQLSRWILRQLLRPFRVEVTNQLPDLTATDLDPVELETPHALQLQISELKLTHANQFREILERLEHLQQAQNQLIREVQTLLQKPTVPPSHHLVSVKPTEHEVYDHSGW